MDNNCDSCFRLTETKHQCVEIPNIFDFDMSICVDLCKSCASTFDWFVYQYSELYEEQARKLVDKKFSLSKKTARGLK